MKLNVHLPPDRQPMKILVLKPPKLWQYDEDARETIHKLANDIAAVLKGTQTIIVPDGWNASVLEVDGIGVDLEK